MSFFDSRYYRSAKSSEDFQRGVEHARGRFGKSEARWEVLKLWLQNNPDKVALVVTPDASFEVRLVPKE